MDLLQEQLGLGWTKVSAWELHLGLSLGGRHPQIAIICCLPQCTLTGHWNGKLSQDPNAGTQIGKCRYPKWHLHGCTNCLAYSTGFSPILQTQLNTLEPGPQEAFWTCFSKLSTFAESLAPGILGLMPPQCPPSPEEMTGAWPAQWPRVPSQQVVPGFPLSSFFKVTCSPWRPTPASLGSPSTMRQVGSREWPAYFNLLFDDGK